ncbi:MAG TPA: alkaline phosphatase family protein [Candidatus Binatus sp.]|nr:alkaline phosphatase family protein [Candidatus Binatus sp.]
MHVRFIHAAAATALLSSIAVAACTQSGPGDITRAIAPASKKHIIIIIQENRSFDNMFNGFPGADTVQRGMTPGGGVPLAAVPFENGTLDPGHFHYSYTAAYDGGKMDGFNGEGTFSAVGGYHPVPEPTNYPYAYLPQSETKPYWNLAKQFTLADRMFTSNSGPSFPAHQYLIAAQSNNADEVPSGLIWGCDAPPGTLVPQLQSDGSESTGVFPCFDYTSLGDELDAAGISWRYYTPGPTYIFNGLDALRNIRYSNDWTTDLAIPETSILTDIASGKLAQVSWVTPQLTNSDHALAASPTGPQWVASIVDAVGASKYWNNTVIFIVWDDWGGWYDHVPPPQLDTMGLGFRVPLIVISPYAKRGYVSHVQHEFGSILRFTEETFGLATLSASDARADDLRDCFDYTQTPLPLQPVSTFMRPADFLRQPRSSQPPDPI